MRLPLAVLLAVSVATTVHARALFCALQDESAKRAFVSDVRKSDSLRAQQLRKLSSRFRRTVNAEYSTFFPTDSGVCRAFVSTGDADLVLGALKARLEASGVTVIVVGSY